MSLKIDFVERAAKGEKVARLCREFGISRTSGHKWIKRFETLGYEGLEEQSRRPKTTPLAMAEELVIATLAARDAHPRWGPRKLEVVLRRRFGDQTPSQRTIARILRRANKVRERRKRHATSIVQQAPHTTARYPNDVWTVDFKGWWQVLDGERCEPLTVRDAHSRFVLAVIVCRPTLADVRVAFEQLFKKYGTPNAIQCDNGTPFIAVRARAGLSQLSAWWVSLGIALVRSRPGCPQDNGGHERMHSDIRADLQARPAASVASEQRRLDRWRQEFNHVRPHEALGGKTPADLYKVKEPRRPTTKQYVYPAGFAVRRVHVNGCVRIRNDDCWVGGTLAGYEIGLELIDTMRMRAWFHDIDLGIVETLPAVNTSCFEVQSPRLTEREKVSA